MARKKLFKSKAVRLGFILSAILITVYIIAQSTIGISGSVTQDIVDQCIIDCSTELGLTGTDLTFCQDNCEAGGTQTLEAIGGVAFLGFFADMTIERLLLWVAVVFVLGWFIGGGKLR